MAGRTGCITAIIHANNMKADAKFDAKIKYVYNIGNSIDGN